MCFGSQSSKLGFPEGPITSKAVRGTSHTGILLMPETNHDASPASLRGPASSTKAIAFQQY